MDIILATGTKGKTTVVRILSNLLYHSGENVLRVDNEGHFINEKQKSSKRESFYLFERRTPTVTPGKYLIEMKKFFPAFAAVFEASIGCGGEGLGCGRHKVGIFTNVFEDHIQKSKGIRSKRDIAKEKDFIVRKIDHNGYLVFNADDKYVCSQLKKISPKKNVTLIPVGFDFKYFPLENHLKNGGTAITESEDNILIKAGTKNQKVVDVKKIPWTFKGQYQPSLYNLMFSIGGIYAYRNKKITKEDIKNISEFKFDKSGGRLTIFKNKDDVKIILDYAHEKYSLREIAKLGNKLKRKRLIGVLRMGKNLRNEVIESISKSIARLFDYIVIYDKIDGAEVKEYLEKGTGFRRKAGEISEIFKKALIDNGAKNVENCLFEEKAIKRASEIAGNGDVVVAIWKEDLKEMKKYIERYFKAKIS